MLARSLLVVVFLAVLHAASSLDQGGDGPVPGFPGGKMPSIDEILAAIDGMKDMTEEDKQQLRDQILSAKEQQGAGVPAGEPMADEEGVPHVPGSIFVPQFLMLLGMLSILALIFVFFGYKLYKSLSERERKREEKKKSKQMKKKK